jgi:asparagine synthase (glutamine-hydrolysing)
MGALWLLIFSNSTSEPITKLFIDKFMSTSSRGPDYSEILTKSTIDIHKNSSIQTQARNLLGKHKYIKYSRQHFMHGYHRLAVNDNTLDASQPFSNGITNLMCNGEIYNVEALKSDYSLSGLTSNSDTEVLLPLYDSQGIQTVLQQARGEFSFIITSHLETMATDNIKIYAACDFIGTRSLYLTYNTEGSLFLVSTELKNIPKHLMVNPKYITKQIPSGQYYDYSVSKTSFQSYFDYTRYSNLSNLMYSSKTPTGIELVYSEISNKIKTSIIEKFTFGDLGYSSILLSGGFDSSLIACIVVEYICTNGLTDLLEKVLFLTVSDCHASEDVIHAKQLIIFLEAKWGVTLVHKIVYISDTTVIVNKLPEIINTIETSNTDDVISSVFYYFLYYYLQTQKLNIVSLLTGDGLDEYFQEHTDNQIFQDNSISKLQNLYSSTLAKTDKLAGNFGIEVRYPYLDFNVFDLILNISPTLRKSVYYSTNQLPIDKYIIRKAFQDYGYLPENILWRPQQEITRCPIKIKDRLINHFDTVFTQSQVAEYNNVSVNTSLDLYIHKTFCATFDGSLVL